MVTVKLRVTQELGALQMVTVTVCCPCVVKVTENWRVASGILPEAGVPPWAVKLAEVTTVGGSVSPMVMRQFEGTFRSTPGQKRLRTSGSGSGAVVGVGDGVRVGVGVGIGVRVGVLVGMAVGVPGRRLCTGSTLNGSGSNSMSIFSIASAAVSSSTAATARTGSPR